jgi:hypothetical protein
MKAQPTISAPKRLVTQKVKELLACNAELARLPKRTQTQIIRDMTSIAAYLTQIPKNGAGERLAQQVDFPEFVDGLLKGVFQAIVTYSIDQMKAYADLVKTVSNSLDAFRDQNISDKQARSFLEEQCRDCFKLQRAKPLPSKKRPATSRQQLLATMVMMGINRIVVTDGKIGAR